MGTLYYYGENLQYILKVIPQVALRAKAGGLEGGTTLQVTLQAVLCMGSNRPIKSAEHQKIKSTFLI